MDPQVIADDGPFRSVIDEHAAAVTAFAARRWPNDAEDLAAEAFAIAWQRWQHEPERVTAGFLISTVKNLARNLHRSHQRDLALVTRLTDRPTSAAPDHAEGIGERSAVADALAQLGDDDQLLLTLVAWDGADTALLAEVLGVTPTAARVRLHRARRRLAAAYRSNEHDEGTPT